jgi:hypothetical protein
VRAGQDSAARSAPSCRPRPAGPSPRPPACVPLGATNLAPPPPPPPPAPSCATLFWPAACCGARRRRRVLRAKGRRAARPPGGRGGGRAPACLELPAPLGAGVCSLGPVAAPDTCSTHAPPLSYPPRYYKSERDVGLNPRGAVDVQVGGGARERAAALFHSLRPSRPGKASSTQPARRRRRRSTPSPRQNCFVELEVEGVAQPPRSGGAGGFQLWGRGRRGVWRFRIVEPGGHLLLWLSTDSRASAEQWVAALDAAGLFVLPPGETAPLPSPPPSLSPSPSREARGSGGAAGAAAGGAAAGARRRAGTPGRQQQHDWEACSTDSELPEPPSRRHGASGSGGGGSGPGYAHSGGGAPVRGRVPWGRPPPSPSGLGESPGALFDAAAPAAAAARVSNTGHPAAAAAAAAAGLPPSGAAAAAAARRSAGGVGAGPPGAAGADAKPPRPPMSGSTPVHTATRYSFLSSDGVWAARHDGLLNLAMIILVVSNLRWGGGGGGVESGGGRAGWWARGAGPAFDAPPPCACRSLAPRCPPAHPTLPPFGAPNPRLILENLLKYGIRYNLVSYVAGSLRPRADGRAPRERLAVLAGFPGLLGFALVALVIELLGLALLRSEDKVRGPREGRGGRRHLARVALAPSHPPTRLPAQRRSLLTPHPASETPPPPQPHPSSRRACKRRRARRRRAPPPRSPRARACTSACCCCSTPPTPRRRCSCPATSCTPRRCARAAGPAVPCLRASAMRPPPSQPRAVTRGVPLLACRRWRSPAPPAPRPAPPSPSRPPAPPPTHAPPLPPRPPGRPAAGLCPDPLHHLPVDEARVLRPLPRGPASRAPPGGRLEGAAGRGAAERPCRLRGRSARARRPDCAAAEALSSPSAAAARPPARPPARPRRTSCAPASAARPTPTPSGRCCSSPRTSQWATWRGSWRRRRWCTRWGGGGGGRGGGRFCGVCGAGRGGAGLGRGSTAGGRTEGLGVWVGGDHSSSPLRRAPHPAPAPAGQLPAHAAHPQALAAAPRRGALHLPGPLPVHHPAVRDAHGGGGCRFLRGGGRAGVSIG